jgi:hypothetical protein
MTSKTLLWEKQHKGLIDRVITDSERYSAHGEDYRVYPLYNRAEQVGVEPIWKSTGYYQDIVGNLERKDGKKIRVR